jgi:hypothetical protein
MQKTANKPNQINQEIEQRLRFLLNNVFEKIIEGAEVSNPTLEYLRKNIHVIQGDTATGFERRRLLWLYSDCVNIFKTTTQGENIRNLINKASTSDGLISTTYKVKQDRLIPNNRKVATKPAFEYSYRVKNK